MVQYYQIAGQKVGSHYLSIGVLTTMFAGIYLATSGKKQITPAKPAINASSRDEENFIQQFLKEADAKDGKKH
nr:atp synthase subunit k, mitochondrial [Quercus suber]